MALSLSHPACIRRAPAPGLPARRTAPAACLTPSHASIRSGNGAATFGGGGGPWRYVAPARWGTRRAAGAGDGTPGTSDDDDEDTSEGPSDQDRGDAMDPAMDQGKASFTTEEMDTLRTRLSRRGQAETELPLILLDALLPRQRLQLAIPANDRMHRAMVTAALDSSRTFAMLGIEPGTGQPLRHGTEVEIVQSEEREDGGVEIVIVGRRKLTLISEPELLPGLGYTVGRVSFSEAAEASPGGVPETDELSLSLQLEPHVEEWQRLVREGGHERSPNQLEELFRDLGPMPPAEDCDDRAIWVAAMINPLPALGVAYEIRPAVLTAQSPTTRLQVALAGIKSSIAHLNGSKPLF